MPVEIRELVIKVKVGEPTAEKTAPLNMEALKKTIAESCRKEVKRQLEKIKER
ncbi:DUF5908 family protein [Spongiimicrobium salis]|uniref:DUF5908 family protein n=1 Tax=Spongiimicrobium salis TaxID=1667022 RepID=UPI00374CD25C